MFLFKSNRKCGRSKINTYMRIVLWCVLYCTPPFIYPVSTVTIYSDYSSRQRKAYVNANFGVLQKVSDNEKVKSDTAQILKDMDVYARTVVFSGKLDPVSIAACKNKHEFCAHWAMRGECEVNLNYHMFNCPLACRMCEHHLEYLRCGGVIQSNEDGDGDMYDDPPTIEADGGMMRLFASMQQHKEYIVDTLVGPAATTANNTMKNQDDPWVLNVENFLNKQECDDLIELANEIGWTPSPRTGGDEHPGVLQHDKPRRTTQSAICGSNSNNNRKACELHPTYQKVLQRIADFLATEGGDAPTGIAAGWMLSHVEQPLEFVKYESTNSGESFSSFSSHGVHHDFSWIDAWKQAGPRVLSLFLTLGVSEKEGSKNVTANMQGGALGFPDLDWLSIPPIKGQAIIWPNVLGSDLNKMNEVMVSEGLPVWEGTKYGVHVWIRMHDYEASRQRGCA